MKRSEMYLLSCGCSLYKSMAASHHVLAEHGFLENIMYLLWFTHPFYLSHCTLQLCIAIHHNFSPPLQNCS